MTMEEVVRLPSLTVSGFALNPRTAGGPGFSRPAGMLIHLPPPTAKSAPGPRSDLKLNGIGPDSNLLASEHVKIKVFIKQVKLNKSAKILNYGNAT